MLQQPLPSSTRVKSMLLKERKRILVMERRIAENTKRKRASQMSSSTIQATRLPGRIIGTQALMQFSPLLILGASPRTSNSLTTSTPINRSNPSETMANTLNIQFGTQNSANSKGPKRRRGKICTSEEQTSRFNHDSKRQIKGNNKMPINIQTGIDISSNSSHNRLTGLVLKEQVSTWPK